MSCGRSLSTGKPCPDHPEVPDAVEAIDMSTVRLMVILREDSTVSLRGNVAPAEVPEALRLVADVFELGAAS